MKNTSSNQRGLTLVELAIAVSVVGVLGMILGPMINSWMTARAQAYQEKVKLDNQSVVTALLNFAANNTASGRLSAPYTGSGRTLAVYDPADATAPGIALSTALTQTGLAPGEINDDNTTSKRVRVYQLVAGLTRAEPLYFRSGPVVTLTYDYGAIYMTDCPVATTTCNPTPATGIPGSSVAITAGNFTNWTTAGTDGPPTFVSSLPLQEQMLGGTAARLDKIRDTFTSYLRAQQVTASAGTATNWLPNQTGASAAGNKTGQTPGMNSGCRDGWYNLADPAVLALPTIGMAQAEFGVTAWGGAIEYCRDYDPTGTQLPDAPPHYGALRINANVSLGLAPDPAVPGNNIVLTF